MSARFGVICKTLLYLDLERLVSVARILDERVSDANLTSILVRAGKEHKAQRQTDVRFLFDPALDIVECMVVSPAYEYITKLRWLQENVVTSK